MFKSIEQGIIPDPQKDVLYVKFKITIRSSCIEKMASTVAREYAQTLEYFDEKLDSLTKVRSAERFENFLTELAKRGEILLKEMYEAQARQSIEESELFYEEGLLCERMVARTWMLEMDDKDLYYRYDDYIRQVALSKPISNPSSSAEQQKEELIPKKFIIEVPFGLSDCTIESTEEEIRSRIVSMYESKARWVVYEKYGVFPSWCQLARHEALFTYAYDIYWFRGTIMIEVEVIL